MNSSFLLIGKELFEDENVNEVDKIFKRLKLRKRKMSVFLRLGFYLMINVCVDIEVFI